MNFPVLEMFHSIQGEGIFTGTPSIFIRVAGCNLRCVFKGSRCDTPYSSFELDKPIVDTVEGAIEYFNEFYKQCPNTSHIVFTGGEPMLYQVQLMEFIKGIADLGDFRYTVETNGSLFNEIGLILSDEWESWIDLWSISPKLSTSVDWECKYLNENQRDNHNKTRINIENLASYINNTIVMHHEDGIYDDNSYFPLIDNGPKFQLKFVYSGEESLVEIKDILDKLVKESGYSKEIIYGSVLLMPEAGSKEQLENNSEECVKVCLENGFRFCDRLHLRIWGNKRCV